MFIVYYYPTFCTVTYKRKINHVTFLYVTSEIGEVEQKMYEELFHLKEMLLAFNLLVCVLNFCHGVFLLDVIELIRLNVFSMRIQFKWK